MEQLITQFDFSILDFIYEYVRCDFLDPIMMCISHFAKSGIGWILLGLILLIPKKTRAFGIMALSAMALGFIINDLTIKNIFMRTRPYDAYEIYHSIPLPFNLNAGKEGSFSFPSGHTCCSFASAVVYLKCNKKWGIPALIFAFLVGFSRMYNYVHYFTDVVGGALVGTACALLVVWVFKKYKLDNKINRINQEA